MSHSSVSSPVTEHPAGGLRELLAVAVPLIISSGTLALMNVTDRVMLTWLSVDAMAASMPGGMLHWTLLSFPYGVAVYTNTFVAQYDGAGRRERVAASIWQGLLMAIVFGLLMAAATPGTRLLVTLFGHAPHVQALEIDYFIVLSYGSLPMLVNVVLSSFFSGRGKTLVVMVVNMASCAMDALLNYLLIFGFGPVKAMGITGAAWGTVLGQLFGCVLFILWMLYGREARLYPLLAERRIDRELIRRMLRYGLPNGMQFVVDVAAYMLLLAFIGRMGTLELAATNLAFTLNSFAFFPLFGVGMAVTTLVGRRIGEGQSHLAKRTSWMGFAIGSAYNAFWIAIYLFAPNTILAPYAAHSDPAEFEALRPVVINLLYFVSLYAFFDGMAVIFGSATRGAGDTRFSLIFTGFSAWTFMVLPITVVWWLGGGLYACWAIVCFQIFALGMGFLYRFVQGRWLKMRVIEPHLIEDDTPLEPSPVADLRSTQTNNELEALEHISAEVTTETRRHGET